MFNRRETGRTPRVRAAVLACVGSILAAGCERAPEPMRVAVGADVLLALDAQTIEARVPRRATLGTLLRQHALSDDLVTALVSSAQTAFDPHRLVADRPYRLVRTIDGLVRRFEYQIDAERFLRIVMPDARNPRTFAVEVLPFRTERRVIAITGTIDSAHPSLIAAMNAAGGNVQLAIALAEIFAGEVDFNNDLQPGDTFRVLVERVVREGQFAAFSPIQAAELVNDGRARQAYRFTAGGGPAGYYDERGRSLRRFMLRSPLKFVPRVTSGFSPRRLHPVLHTYRAHLGVDYGARTGAPVVAVAGGAVVSAAFSGGAGRMVHVRHGGAYESMYLHLSRFAKGIRPGVRVDQGQVIGYVGSSGLATGPHLDYRLKKNGAFVNPLREHRRMPEGETIAAAALTTFSAAREQALEDLGAPPAPASLVARAGTSSLLPLLER